jgi:hypothetical protein
MRLGPAYTQLLRLGGFLETDIRVQKDLTAMDDPLDADIHGLLTALVRAAAPWLRGFPTVETWDDEAGKALSRPDLFQPARDFVRIARDDLVIPQQDAAEMAALGEAGGERGYQQNKAGNRSVAGTWNLILALGTFLSGAVASDFATRSPLVQRAGATLAATETAVEAFAATRSPDLRQALLALTREGGQVDAPTPTALPVKVDPLVPEDVQEQARRMILAGHAPPEAWRPFILHLNFIGETALTDMVPLAGLTALQNLLLTRTQVSDVAPLAGLTALQNLLLTRTQVSDVAPLAGLTAMLSLYLTGTQVSDVAPLAGLTALQNLLLANTQVSDVAPLAGLIALQSLHLDTTQVSDVAPLAALIALQFLSLDNTQVSDVAPLAGLTALQNLRLSGTQVSDVAPLAGLIALQELWLDDTQVSDVAPLAGLIALQSLSLTRTQVSDVAPLAGLIALQNLYLTGTQVSDVAPLAGLIALRRLDLSSTPVRDISALDRLEDLEIVGGPAPREPRANPRRRRSPLRK